MLLAPPVLPLSLLALSATAALFAGGAWLVYAWFAGIVAGTAYLVAGIAMLVWTLCGRLFLLPFLGRPGADDPHDLHSPTTERLQRPDGTEINVELLGPQDGPPLVLIHGWGTTTDDWFYVKRAMGDRYRLIAWDLRGHGKTSRPPRHDYSLETMAHDLAAVLELAGGRPAVIAGHSIGGMIALTYCRLFPHQLHRQVAGLALVNTTYTNPARTTSFAGFFSAIQKPILEPLMHLVIWTSPLVWLLNWMGYFSGAGLLVARITGFAGTQTRGQLDFAAQLAVRPTPATQARGVLAMFRYDATHALRSIDVPTLIVTADHDRILVPQASAQMRNAIPEAGLYALRPGGHMALYERPDDLVPELSAFLERCFAQAEAAAKTDRRLIPLPRRRVA